MGGGIIIYGAGALGHEVYYTLCKHLITPQFFCSGLHSGYIDETTGLKVISKSALISHRNCILIFAIGDAATEDEKKLFVMNETLYPHILRWILKVRNTRP